MFRLFVAALVLGLWFAPRIGAASEAFELDWEAPASCPGAAFVFAEAQRQRTELSDIRRPLRATGTVRPEASRWRLELRVDDAEPRVVEASSCEELASVAAFVLAMTLDSYARENVAAERPPAAASSLVTRATSESSRAPVPAPQERSSPDPFSVVIRAEAEFAYGGVPVLSGGARAGVGAENANWNAEVGLRWLPITPRGVRGRMLPGGAFQLLAGVASGGYAFVWGRTRLELVLGFELGTVIGSELGASSRSSLWMAFDAGIRLRQRVDERFGFFLAIDGSFPVVRDRWTIDGDEVARVSPVGFSARIGEEFVF